MHVCARANGTYAREGAHLRASTQMGTGLGATEGAHMYVILDAHVSRSNTSGSAPPRLPLGLIVHVVPAQSVTHAKLYVPTLKWSTAHRCADHMCACGGPGQPALRCGAADQRRRARPCSGRKRCAELESAPGAAVGVAVASNNLCAARMEGCVRAEASNVAPATHGACRERNATCGVASC
jgi:hypothetical protein